MAKSSPRIELLGTVDEANAAIGLARLHTKSGEDSMLARIQNDLFDVGADIAAPPAADGKSRLRVAQEQIDRLEGEIDAMNETLAPLTSFVLPGGSAASAHLHFARTVVRRAERVFARVANPSRSTIWRSPTSIACPIICSCWRGISTRMARATCCGNPAARAQRATSAPCATEVDARRCRFHPARQQSIR